MNTKNIHKPAPVVAREGGFTQEKWDRVRRGAGNRDEGHALPDTRSVIAFVAMQSQCFLWSRSVPCSSPNQPVRVGAACATRSGESTAVEAYALKDSGHAFPWLTNRGENAGDLPIS